jgi:hypothetical protein
MSTKKPVAKKVTKKVKIEPSLADDKFELETEKKELQQLISDIKCEHERIKSMNCPKACELISMTVHNLEGEVENIDSELKELQAELANPGKPEAMSKTV